MFFSERAAKEHQYVDGRSSPFTLYEPNRNYRFFLAWRYWPGYDLLKFRTPNGARFRIWCGVNKIFWGNNAAISLNRYT